MRHIWSLSLPVLIATLLLGACNSVPKHASLIPKDAVVVLAVNTGGISKEVAWSKITGSKILDELQESANDPQAKQGLKDIEHMGIDWMSTTYIYTKADTRFPGEQRVTAVAPLKDTKEWEGWVKKVFPESNIHDAGKLKVATLDKMLAAWDGDVLMVMKSAVTKVPRTVRLNIDSAMGGTGNNIQEYQVTDEVPDEATTLAELQTAFKTESNAAITSNKRFNELMKEGHDVSLYLNYDNLMNTASATGMMSTVAMGSAMWKEATMTGGIDFGKGQVDGVFNYYTSDSMQAIAKEFGKSNVDETMLSRIPSQNLNLVAGYHLSLPAVKMMLDRMGYTGMANMQLTQVGLTVDDILAAFTGDITFFMNNFNVRTEMKGTDTISQALGMRPYPSSMPVMDYVYAMKIGNRAAFDKILGLITREGGLQASAPNTYTLPGGMLGNITLMVGDKYIAVANTAPNAQAFLAKDGTVPAPVKSEVSGHPAGVYADIQSFLIPAQAAMSSSPSDSLGFAEARRVFSTFSMQGGEYKKDANKYSFTLKLMDKSENSLLQFLQLGQRMAKARKQQKGMTAMHITGQ